MKVNDSSFCAGHGGHCKRPSGCPPLEYEFFLRDRVCVCVNIDNLCWVWRGWGEVVDIDRANALTVREGCLIFAMSLVLGMDVDVEEVE
jgi:hypothetical protein